MRKSKHLRVSLRASSAGVTLLSSSLIPLKLRPGTSVKINGPIFTPEGRTKTEIQLGIGEIEDQYLREYSREPSPRSDSQIRSPNAVTGCRGTTYTVSCDEQLQASTIIVRKVEINAVPTNTSLSPFSLSAGQQVQGFPDKVGDITSISEDDGDNCLSVAPASSIDNAGRRNGGTAK